MDLLLGGAGRRLLKIFGWTMLVLILLPVLVMAPVSFGSGHGLIFPPAEFSLEWYENLINDRRWLRAATVSFEVALLATVFALILGVCAALGVNRAPKRVRKALQMFFIAPMIVPLMVLGVGFYMIFAQLKLLGSVWPLAFAHAIVVLPFVMMPVMARLKSLDPALERAGASLGAGIWRTQRDIILPLLAPAIAAAAVFAFIFSFDEVVLAQLLAGPRFETLPRKIWESITQNGLDKTITAVSTVQFALVLLILMLSAFWSRGRALRGRMATRRAARIAAEPAPRSLSAAAVGDIAPPSAPLAPISSIRRPSAQRTAPVTTGDHHGFGIRFYGLTKYYDEKPAVEDVTFDVAPGEFVTILGPSGSGKTTLLMLVAGFTSADAGRLVLGDREISHTPPHKRDIGIVFQSYALFPHMNVARNVGYPLKVRGERKSRVVDALSRVHMQDYAERRVSQLSGGQQQRIALARAISFQPRALLMDEPLAALDRNLRQQMQTEIRSLQRSLGQTVVFVTHDQEEALNMSDRVAVMNEGRLQQIASPKELYLAPANSFVAGFFGESNLFRGAAAGDTLTIDGRALPLPDQRQGSAVLCVRPEAVRLDPVNGGGDAPGWALPGEVRDARFLGSTLRIELETPLGDVIATRQIDGLSTAPEPGSRLAISWAPNMSSAMAS